MNCPYCGRVMQRGHITGKSILRIIPEKAPPRSTTRYTREELDQIAKTELPGWVLDIPYAGLAPWVPARYCAECKKVLCELDLLDMKKEETP